LSAIRDAIIVRQCGEAKQRYAERKVGCSMRSIRWLLLAAACASCSDGGSSDALDALDATDYAYEPLAADGGACPLAQRIELWTAGNDLDPRQTQIELVPPATVVRTQRFTGDIESQCMFRPPSCDDPAHPDFAELAASIAEPEVQGSFTAIATFGPNVLGYTANTSVTIEGLGQVRIYADAPPAPCDATDPHCVPPPVRELFDLVSALSLAHVCEEPSSAEPGGPSYSP
jgi:hypothetical protein